MPALPEPRRHVAQQPTVLIVEDEKPLLALVQRVLERAGYGVIARHEPLDALAWWSDPRNRRTIDLILTDVVMPGISGPEMIQRMRATAPGVAVLMMTGKIDDDRYSAHALLTKPFTPTELVAAVRAVLDSEDGVRA
jgi:two-component system, cell cycle sensor histidine kinase and response regulator CckA